MHERLKKLRSVLGLTQQQFADKIGSKRNTIAKYETQANVPSTAVISLICREFNVNEEWLRNGIGEMFLPENRKDEIEKVVRSLFNSETDSFKSRFIAMLAKLSTSDWERLEQEAIKLLDSKKEEFADNIEPANIQTEVEKAEEEYIKSISNSAKKTKSVALHTINDENTNENKAI